MRLLSRAVIYPGASEARHALPDCWLRPRDHVALAALTLAPPAHAQSPPVYDLVIANGRTVVFDADRFTERTTFDSLLPSEGMRFVIVGGQVVVEEGEVLGVTPGQPVRVAREP